MAAASLSVALIGQVLAQARGLVTKHAGKQVDRLLSNNGIDVWDSFLGELGFCYLIRFRGNSRVTAEDGETKPATAWAGKGGCARKLRQYRVMAHGRQVGAVVPRRERPRGGRRNAGQPLCQALDDRACVPRHQGSVLWHGAVGHAHR